jgi:branched-chain amino acid transport system substrate-binding protein
MKELTISDALIKNGSIREDGRVIRDYYLLEVKKPSESKYAWDYFTVIEVVPGIQVTRPLAEGDCPLVAKK